jgi:hypothetical protein
MRAARWALIRTLHPPPCAAGCIVFVKWQHGREEYAGSSIVVPRHRNDEPRVFRVVPMIDDGRESRKTSLHCTMLATQVPYDVQDDWKVREFSSYKELFSAIIEMGKEHARHCHTTVKATVPVPPVKATAHIFVVLTFEKRGLLDAMDLIDAKTLKSVPNHKIRSQRSILEYLEQQEYWSMSCSNLQSYLPPLSRGDP